MKPEKGEKKFKAACNNRWYYIWHTMGRSVTSADKI